MPKLLSNNSLPIVTTEGENIARAVELLRAGQLVAFPTETVYGLGAAAENEEAVRAIYATKGRPSHNPLIVHVTGPDMAERYGVFTPAANTMLPLFEQGLTLVLPRNGDLLAPSVTAGGETVALRVPQHPVAQALIAALGAGIAAPSANRSGRISPTQASHVAEEFSEHPGALRLILDGGECAVGLESTVLDCSGASPYVLRTGSISLERLRTLLPSITVGKGEAASETLRSPGMLASHYAPNARVRLNAHDIQAGEALLAFGEERLFHDASHWLNLSPSGNLEEAAHHLYDYLRRLDATGVATIAVMPISEEGIGAAINDRLKRAAAGR